MADLDVRDLERRWRQTRSTEDEVHLLQALLRTGRLLAGRLTLAAALGHQAALRALDAHERPDLRSAITAAGHVAAASISHACASLLSDRWAQNKKYGSRPEFFEALRAASGWAEGPNVERADAARTAAQALERLMDWSLGPAQDADAADRRRVKAGRQRAKKPIEKAAAAAMIAATTAAAAQPRGAVTGPKDSLAAEYACDAFEVVASLVPREEVIAAVQRALLPWIIGDVIEQTAVVPPRGRASDAVTALKDEIRKAPATDTPRFTAGDAQNRELWRTDLCSTAADFGKRVVMILQRANGNFRGGRLSPGHVAAAIRGLERLPGKDGLTWFWIDGEEVVSAPEGRVTLALVVQDADEVRVTTYHRPRPSERTCVWGYTTGGSPDRLALSTRSRADAIKTWSTLAPVARALRLVASEWAENPGRLAPMSSEVPSSERPTNA